MRLGRYPFLSYQNREKDEIGKQRWMQVSRQKRKKWFKYSPTSVLARLEGRGACRLECAIQVAYKCLALCPFSQLRCHTNNAILKNIKVWGQTFMINNEKWKSLVCVISTIACMRKSAPRLARGFEKFYYVRVSFRPVCTSHVSSGRFPPPIHRNSAKEFWKNPAGKSWNGPSALFLSGKLLICCFSLDRTQKRKGNDINGNQ